jgi:gamma-glutamyltranspeptidase/glutathione hydrolase
LIKRAAAFLLAFALSACASDPYERAAIEPAPAWRLQGQAMIAAADPRAVDAGLEILKKGGSALDAAIAAEAVLGLVEPQSSGLGGGALMLTYNLRTDAVRFFDGRETAPSGANAQLFIGAEGKPLSFMDAAHSGLSVGVPGLIPMLALAHQKEGKLPWADLFEPAIKLAEDGFVVSPRLNLLLQMSKAGRLDDVEPGKSYFYDPKGEPRPAGYLLKNAAYANTLRAIAKDGGRAMLDSPIAANIVKAVQDDARPGKLSLDDLRNYKPVEREALCAPYRKYEVCTSAPPGGGLGVLSALGIMDRQKKSGKGVNDADSWGLFIDSSRLGYADRDYYVSDPDKIEIPAKGLLNAKYLDARARMVKIGAKLKAAAPGDPAPFTGETSLLGHWAGDQTDEVPGTTHLSVVDASGNVASLTATVEAAFGNQMMVDGFVLNNELTDFNTTPSPDGRPFANAPGPSKRPRSSMSPTIIFTPNGEFYAATGSPGGSSIIAYTLKTIVGMIDWKLSPQDAAAAPNVVARGGVVRAEVSKLPPGVADALTTRGYKLIDSTGEASGLHIVRAGPKGLEGGADPRREGVAKGF